MPFTFYGKEVVHASSLALILQNNLDLADAANVIHSLDHVPSLRPYNTLHFLTNSEYLFREILLEQKFTVR